MFLLFRWRTCFHYRKIFDFCFPIAGVFFFDIVCYPFQCLCRLVIITGVVRSDFTREVILNMLKCFCNIGTDVAFHACFIGHLYSDVNSFCLFFWFHIYSLFAALRSLLFLLCLDRFENGFLPGHSSFVIWKRNLPVTLQVLRLTMSGAIMQPRSEHSLHIIFAIVSLFFFERTLPEPEYIDKAS